MANKHTTLADLFSDIASAIREKTGSSDGISADDFPDAIRAISVGPRITTFTLASECDYGTPGVYKFEEGMTWGEFIESDYNSAGLTLAGTLSDDTKYVTGGHNTYVYSSVNNLEQYSTDIIVAGATYTVYE